VPSLDKGSKRHSGLDSPSDFHACAPFLDSLDAESIGLDAFNIGFPEAQNQRTNQKKKWRQKC
jgi:hypothetical protein